MEYVRDVLYFTPTMHDDLIILATTRSPHADFTVDKHLIGYSTIQFMQHGRRATGLR
jgi:hypothetical protein